MENITINGNVTVNIGTYEANTTAAIPETKESYVECRSDFCSRQIRRRIKENKKVFLTYP